MFDPRRHAALKLADALVRDSAVLDPQLMSELRGHFDEVEMAELILVCAQANFNNRAGNAAKQLLGPAPD